MFSKMTLGYSVLNFLWKENMVQSKKSFCKFSQKWHYPIQFSIFSEKTVSIKSSSPFLNFLKNDITLFSSLFFSEKTTWFKPSSPFLSFLKNDITLFSSQFSLKRQHDSYQVVYFYIFSKVTWHCSVLNFLWIDSMVQTK